MMMGFTITFRVYVTHILEMVTFNVCFATSTDHVISLLIAAMIS